MTMNNAFLAALALALFLAAAVVSFVPLGANGPFGHSAHRTHSSTWIMPNPSAYRAEKAVLQPQHSPLRATFHRAA
jgi:hypothetical protein